MMQNKYHIILASNSPRRRELLSGLGINFSVSVKEGIDESYPPSLPVLEVAEYIATKKSDAYKCGIQEGELVLTADTIVALDNVIYGKPKDESDAIHMLKSLSGHTHHVVTGVCLTTTERQQRFSVCTDVTFKQLSEAEIKYYVSHYQPFDKAGAYGIQEWIGYIGVTSISGSYYNVMGLPVQRIYEELCRF